MQSDNDLICPECNKSYTLASELLQHFAKHVIEDIIESADVQFKQNDKTPKQLPDLHPIHPKELSIKHDTFDVDLQDEAIGVNALNPMKFCIVTMNEAKESMCNLVEDTVSDRFQEPKNENTNEFVLNEKNRTKLHVRKYECTICSRIFGWSTDLKRHILTHTGERPFRCKYCDSTFTRNFLLQKHSLKQHPNERLQNSQSQVKIPDLKPIRCVLKHKSRKQEKYKIKRKAFNAKNLYPSEKERYQFKTNILCST